MASHEFGIMDRTPCSGENYVDYEPEMYNCISVDDELIEKVDRDTQDIMCFWHTIDRPEKGLAYCGITLIPPAALDHMIALVEDRTELSELKELLEKAAREKKFVIHFGI